MKLEFETIRELEEFLMFTAHIGGAFRTAPSQAELAAYAAAGYPGEKPPPYDKMDKATVSENGASAEPASPPVGDLAGSEPDAAGAPTPAASEPAKRKRRTKVEMEAERTAAIVADAGAPSENPFAVSAGSQAVLDAPNQSAATLAGIAAMQNGEPETPVSTVHERALQILADPTQTESIAHLRACQGFIQAHGMTKYNESFRDGLNANIAAYTPEQRALHIAILESLA